MRERARTVIVGGGPAAMALAASLAAGGDTDVLVLDPRAERADREVPTARFGAVLQAGRSDHEVRLARASIDAFAALAVDDAAVWRRVGSLELATSAPRAALLGERAAMLAAAGVGAERISPGAAASLVPGLDASAVLGALHVPSDGVADRAAGVTIARGVRVTDLRLADGRVDRVETDAGAVSCERLVLASCTASVGIATRVGIMLPVVAVPRTVRITGPVPDPSPEAMPVLRHPDEALAIRGRGDRLGIAGHGDPTTWAAAASRILPGHAEAFASLASPAEAATVTATPDGAPIIGEHLGVRGLWFLVGARLAHVPPLADALAARLLGRPVADAVDLRSADPNRWYPFEVAPSVAAPRAVAIVRSTHDLVPPSPDELAPRRLRLSPITRRAEELGAAWTAVSGWEVPRWFSANGGDRDTAVAAEVRAARGGVAITDRTPLAKFDVLGEAAISVVLRRMVEGPVPGFGEVARAGGMRSEGAPPCTVVRKGPAALRVLADARSGPRVLAWLRAELDDRDRTLVVERTGSLFAIGTIGPRAEAVLAAVVDVPVDADAFPTGTARYLGVGPVTPVWAHREAIGGIDAWTLFGQVAMGERAWDLLVAAGRPSEIVPIGSDALEALRSG